MFVADESFYSTLNTIQVQADGKVVQDVKKDMNYTQVIVQFTSVQGLGDSFVSSTKPSPFFLLGS